MNDKAQEIAGLLDKGEKIQAEFQELEQNEVGFDGEAVHEFMEENKIDSPKDAYRKMNGLEPTQPSEAGSSFRENMSKMLPKSEPSYKTPSGLDTLTQQMKDFFNREK